MVSYHSTLSHTCTNRRQLSGLKLNSPLCTRSGTSLRLRLTSETIMQPSERLERLHQKTRRTRMKRWLAAQMCDFMGLVALTTRFCAMNIGEALKSLRPTALRIRRRRRSGRLFATSSHLKRWQWCQILSGRKLSHLIITYVY